MIPKDIKRNMGIPGRYVRCSNTSSRGRNVDSIIRLPKYHAMAKENKLRCFLSLNIRKTRKMIPITEISVWGGITNLFDKVKS